MSANNEQNRSVAREDPDQPLPEETDSRVISRRVGDAGVIHTITSAVVDARERPMDEFPPIGSVIDGDALESLWRDMGNSATRCTVSFQYAGCDVAVTHDRVRVEAPSPRRHSGSPQE